MNGPPALAAINGDYRPAGGDSFNGPAAKIRYGSCGWQQAGWRAEPAAPISPDFPKHQTPGDRVVQALFALVPDAHQEPDAEEEP